MRIAIDCRLVGSTQIGSYISEIVQQLILRHNCLLIGTHAQCMEFVRDENVEFCFCDTEVFSLEEIRGFPKNVEERILQYEIFFSPSFNVPGKIPIPVVSTIHDLADLEVPNQIGFSEKIKKNWFLKRAIEKSEKIVTTSEFSKNRIREILNCQKKIVVTPGGISSHILKGRKIEESEKRDTILFVGNSYKNKGLLTLLCAFENAKSQGFSGKLVLVGKKADFKDGDTKTVDKLRALCTNESSGVVFTGKIAKENLRGLYENALVLVQPSIYDGFCTPPLEAMSTGTRAIVSDIPVFKEIFENLPVQFFEAQNETDLAKKILEIDQNRLNDDEVSKVLGAYSYAKSAEILCKTFKEILGNEENEEATF